VLLLGGIALTVATIHACGGIAPAIEASKSRGEWELLLPMNDPDFPWTMYLGASLCVSTFYCAANQFIVQRVLAAKDEWHARMGVIFTDYLKFLIPLIIIVPGLLARQLVPDLARADEVFPTLVKELLPVGLVGLVMAGLIAAVMGHISGAINSCTTIVTVDFYLPFKRWRANRQAALAGLAVAAATPADKPTVVIDYARASTPMPPVEQPDAATDAQAVRFGRIFAIIVVVVGILWTEALSRNIHRPMFIYLLNAYGWFAPGIGTMFLLGILWKRTTHAGALTAGALTVPLSGLIQWYRPGMSFMNRTGIVFWLCMAACAAVSLVTRPKSEHELKGLVWTRDSLRLPLEERHKYHGLRRPVVWWAIITAVVLFFYIRYA
jgi:SSS family solute:Na+ symporter